MPPRVRRPGTTGRGRWRSSPGTELATTDLAAACDYYAGLFDWVKTDAMDMDPGEIYQMFGRSKERSMGGIFKEAPEMPGPSAWLHYIDVAGVVATLVTELGGQVFNGPMDVPDGNRVAQCLDPQGAAFALHSTPTAS